jgi:cephalosporin hydroxylase
MSDSSSPNLQQEQTELLWAYRKAFFQDLIARTKNFGTVTWLGYPIWQNILDLWTIQETISQIRPALLVECGTNRGGSALFYAHLMDLLGHGRVISVDITRMHNLTHPRIEFLIGSSIDKSIVGYIENQARLASGHVLVILDSDHSARHVHLEMEAYGPIVSPGSYMLVQDGVIDQLEVFQSDRPGPLVAITEFLSRHPEFQVDVERCERFVISHHPYGWLRRSVGSLSDGSGRSSPT